MSVPCCWVCLEEGPAEDTGDVLERSCSCRGSAGYVHVGCVVEHAKRASDTVWANAGPNTNVYYDVFHGWQFCPTCKQKYQGRMAEAIMERCAAHFATDGPLHLSEYDIRCFQSKLLLAEYRFGSRKYGKCLDVCQGLLVVLKDGERMGLIPEFGARQNEVEILHYVAYSYRGLGQYDESLAVAKRALDMSTRYLDPNGELTIKSKQCLNTIEREMFGKSNNDVDLARKDLELVLERCGKESFSAIVRMNALASALENSNQLAEAIDLMEETVVIARRSLGPDHPETEVCTQHLERIKTQRRRQQVIKNRRATTKAPKANVQSSDKLAAKTDEEADMAAAALLAELDLEETKISNTAKTPTGSRKKKKKKKGKNKSKK